MTRPGLPIFTRFYQAKNSFLGYADLQRSAEILLHSILTSAMRSAFLLFFVLFFHRRSGQTGDCIIILLLR